jgi:cytochrome c oxidase subunit III
MRHVASASAVGTPAVPAPVNRPNTVSVGTIVWLSSELMFFAALFAMYFTTRSVNPDLWKVDTNLLNVPFAAYNATVLVLSSVTCQFGVFAAEKGQARRTGSMLNLKLWGMREWFVLTFVMGAMFIAGQLYEYSNLVRDGLTLSSDHYGSVFYLTTGFHGLHVTGGLIAFLLVLGRSYAGRRKVLSHRQATSAIVVSYYWHFVDVIWIALFSTIYLLK